MNGTEEDVARGRCATAVGAVQSHRGLVRSNNEDSYVFDLSRGRFAVIDGMGGQQAGEVAAGLVRNALLQEDQLPRAIHRANEQIYERASASPVERGMGCVVTAVQIENGRLEIAHVGDTRAYLARENGCRLLTRDHTTAADRQQDLVLSDAVARTLPGQHQVTRDVGGLPHADESWILTGDEPFEPGDLLLLCSDGLHDLVPSDELYGKLRKAKNEEQDPAMLVRSLVRLALERGGKDNVTVLAVRREAEPEPEENRAQPPARAGRTAMMTAVALASIATGALIYSLVDRFWLDRLPRTVRGLAAASSRPVLVTAGPAGLAGDLHPGQLIVAGPLEAGGGVQKTVVRASALGSSTATIRGLELRFPGEGPHEWQLDVEPGATLELVQASIRAPNLVLRVRMQGPQSRLRILDAHVEIGELIVEGHTDARVELRGGFFSAGPQADRLVTSPGPLVLSAPYPQPPAKLDEPGELEVSGTPVTQAGDAP